MTAGLLILVTGLAATPSLETLFVQVGPAHPEGTLWRTPGRERAVVLIHGLRLHPVSESRAATPALSRWESPNGLLVRSLTKEADVFAFCYAQTAAVDEVARVPELAESVSRLKKMGYRDVVFVGYSAGAIIARQFVEDAPAGGGVNKVIQVCAPNGGSAWTALSPGVRPAQAPFVLSLTKEARDAVRLERGDARIPAEVEFVCIVGVGSLAGDGLVRTDRQWTPDLQDQGIPATTIYIQHVGAMYSARMAALVAELVRTPQPRWSPAEVEAARSRICGPTVSFSGGSQNRR